MVALIKKILYRISRISRRNTISIISLNFFIFSYDRNMLRYLSTALYPIIIYRLLTYSAKISSADFA
jgi:hypothetical protein